MRVIRHPTAADAAKKNLPVYFAAINYQTGSEDLEASQAIC